MTETAYEWVAITPEDKEAITREKNRATASSKLFTLKEDSNNAPGHCEKTTRESVIDGAADAVLFLNKIGFLRKA
jgi:flagellar biosynthesis/type III secretory pathway protein FliH